MSRLSHNDATREPDEALLLAWVEGESLPHADEALVAGYLLSNPEMAKRLEAMRVDREMLRSIDDQGVPEDLLQRVGGQVVPLLERRMLLDDAPIVTRKLTLVGSSRRSIVRTLLLDSTGRKIAAAAAILLVAGAGVYFAATSLSGTKNRVGSSVIAQGSSTGQPQPGMNEAHLVNPIHTDPGESALVQPSVVDAHEALAMGPTANQPWTLEGLVENERYAQEQGIITPSAAIDLAQTGRLVLRVRGTNETADLTNVAGLLRDGDGSWALVNGEEDPGNLLADEYVVKNLPGLVADVPSIASPINPVLVVQARLDTGTLRSLCKKLRDAQVQVSFEKREGALKPDEFALSGAKPRGMFAPPGWSPVPIIVETSNDR